MKVFQVKRRIFDSNGNASSENAGNLTVEEFIRWNPKRRGEDFMDVLGTWTGGAVKAVVLEAEPVKDRIVEGAQEVVQEVVTGAKKVVEEVKDLFKK